MAPRETPPLIKEPGLYGPDTLTEGKYLRDGSIALAEVSRADLAKDLPGGAHLAETLVSNPHKLWATNVSPGLDEKLPKLEAGVQAAEEAIASAGFDEAQGKELEEIAAMLQADPRDSRGELGSIYGPTMPVTNAIIRLQRFAEHPAIKNVPEKRAAVASLRKLCDERLSMLHISPYHVERARRRLEEGKADAATNRFWKANGLLLAAIAGAFGIITGLAALHGKRSLVPASIYLLIAFLAGGGAKLFSRSKSEAALSKLEFLGKESYREIADRNGIKGERGERIASAILDHEAAIRDYRTNLKEGTDPADARMLLLDALELRESGDRDATERMLQHGNDFGTLAAFLAAGKDSEMRENILACIRHYPEKDEFARVSKDMTAAYEKKGSAARKRGA